MDDDTRAELLDAIYVGSGRNYLQETDELTSIIRRHLPISESVLGVACGGGLHLLALQRHFGRVEGTETFDAMCRIARSRVGDIPIHFADARTMQLTTTFDSIVVLFSTISRAHDNDELAGTLRNLVKHLSPGGVLVIDPWYTPDEWQDNTIAHVVAKTDSKLVIRASHSTSSGTISTSHMAYLVGRPESGIAIYRESRDLTLFSYPEYLAAFRAAGMVDPEVVRLPPRFRPRIVGTREHREP